MRNAKWKGKQKRTPLGMKLCFLPPVDRKRREDFDVLIECVGTDGARTRSFRLDRAVLWPIELQSHGNKGSSRKLDSFFFLGIGYLWRTGGLYHFVVYWRIVGPSWIWTSVDILPTNLQSVPINRSGIDPGRIDLRFIDNPWSTSFRSALPPGEVESPLPPWKRDVLNH